MTTRQVDIWLPFNKNFIGGGILLIISGITSVLSINKS